MARNSQIHLRRCETFSSTRSHLVCVATGILSLCYAAVHLSRGDPHQEFQPFAGWPACGAEYNCLAGGHHDARFSLSVSCLCNRFDCASAAFRAAATVAKVARSMAPGLSLQEFRSVEAMTSQTRSNSDGRNSGNIGRLRHSQASFSAAGKSPDRCPRKL